MVRALDLRLKGHGFQLLAVSLSSRQVTQAVRVHTTSVAKQYNLVAVKWQ